MKKSVRSSWCLHELVFLHEDLQHIEEADWERLVKPLPVHRKKVQDMMQRAKLVRPCQRGFLTGRLLADSLFDLDADMRTAMTRSCLRSMASGHIDSFR